MIENKKITLSCKYIHADMQEPHRHYTVIQIQIFVHNYLEQLNFFSTKKVVLLQLRFLRSFIAHFWFDLIYAG